MGRRVGAAARERAGHAADHSSKAPGSCLKVTVLAARSIAQSQTIFASPGSSLLHSPLVFHSLSLVLSGYVTDATGMHASAQELLVVLHS